MCPVSTNQWSQSSSILFQIYILIKWLISTRRLHCYNEIILFWELCTCTFAPQCLRVQANHPQGPNSVALLIAMSSTIQLCTEIRDTQPQDNKMFCSSSARFLLVLPLHLHSSGSRQLTKCHSEWLSPETDRHTIPLDHGVAWNIVFCEMSKWRCWFVLIKRRDSWKEGSATELDK